MSHPIIRNYLRVAAGNEPADTVLLARFAMSHDETAFELLVWRHSSLVQRVCWGVLGDYHAAEDATQATFLILARKARTFSGNQSVVGWLYKVARRVAIRLAKNRARGSFCVDSLDQVPANCHASTASRDEMAALCSEVDHLPERYRVPVLLCFFEGLTHAEAARRTGWAIGTVAGRLARAKHLLSRRLSSKGIGTTSVILALPAGSFVGSTAQAAVAFALRGTIAPGVEPTVSHLAEGVLKTMTSTKQLSVVMAALSCLVIASTWVLTVRASSQSETSPATQPVAATQPAGAAQPAAGTVQPVVKERNATSVQMRMSLNKLKQLALAVVNYHDTYIKFPRDITDKDGKPLLSWRVEILPYIAETNLYKEFHLDEPWDSEHNKKLMAKMPDVYRIAFDPKDATKTYYKVFAGPGAPFDPSKKVKIADIVDGTSNTIGVVEAGPPVEWSKPDDIAYDPKKPLPKLELPYKNAFAFSTLDGAVRILSPDIDPNTLRALIEYADGQPIPDLSKWGVKFPIRKEEIETTRRLLKENEKLLEAIGEQLREQQKLLEELGKKQNLPVGSGWVDSDYADQMHKFLDEQFLMELKRTTESLRKLVEASNKK